MHKKWMKMNENEWKWMKMNEHEIYICTDIAEFVYNL